VELPPLVKMKMRIPAKMNYRYLFVCLFLFL